MNLSPRRIDEDEDDRLAFSSAFFASVFPPPALLALCYVYYAKLGLSPTSHFPEKKIQMRRKIICGGKKISLGKFSGSIPHSAAAAAVHISEIILISFARLFFIRGRQYPPFFFLPLFFFPSRRNIREIVGGDKTALLLLSLPPYKREAKAIRAPPFSFSSS